MIVAASGSATAHFVEQFFDAAPKREELGSVSMQALPRAMLDQAKHADLVVACVNPKDARSRFDQRFIVSPRWVGSALTLPADIHSFIHRSKSLSNNLRRVRNAGMTSEVTSGSSDFAWFYHHMYRPYIVERHKSQAVIRNFHLLRRAHRRGGILWITHKGVRRAGTLFSQHENMLKLLVMGVRIDTPKHTDAAERFAIYLYLIELAQQRGCTQLDLGGSRATLNDGLLQHKRRWDARLYEKSDNYQDIVLCWNRWNPAIQRFFAATPLIFREHGGLSALTATQGNASQARRLHHTLAIDGLSRLYVVSPRTPARRIQTDDRHYTQLVFGSPDRFVI